MPGFSLLAPIPARHLERAIEMLKDKEYVLFGSGAYKVLSETGEGAKVLIYVSHDEADPVVTYTGIYRGLVSDRLEMRKLKNAGYRPDTTAGEEWDLFWRLSNIEQLPTPIRLTDIQLVGGSYLTSYPRGPIHVVS